MKVSFSSFFPLFLGYIFDFITTKGGKLPTKSHYSGIPRQYGLLGLPGQHGLIG